MCTVRFLFFSRGYHRKCKYFSADSGL